MRFLSLLALVAGCGFQVSGGAPTGDDLPGDDQPHPDGSDGGSDSPDAAMLIEVAHVAATDEAALTSTFEWTISQDQVLDTGTMTANPPLPAGVVVKAVAQETGGPELLILQAKSIELASTISFRVIGTRALVLVASSEITISGTLEASADHQSPGPGGAASGAGTGAGAQANNDNNGWDTGANGASFGSAGGKGGDVPDPHTVLASAATAPYGDAPLALLVGGSGGGNATPLACNTKGGGGGGAIQLTAPTVTLDGAVRASGGGGVGGSICGSGPSTDASSGGGGGSGGSIYIQATTVAGTGWLTANGGAGGGGGCQSCTGADRIGGSGENGSTMAVAATGGSSSLTPAGFGFGGAGGVSGATAANGVQGGNGGGGGGGIGRIHLTAMPSSISAINASPAAQ